MVDQRDDDEGDLIAQRHWETAQRLIMRRASGEITSLECVDALIELGATDGS